jgi:hypothetical protein
MGNGTDDTIWMSFHIELYFTMFDISMFLVAIN